MSGELTLTHSQSVSHSQRISVIHSVRHSVTQSLSHSLSALLCCCVVASFCCLLPSFVIAIRSFVIAFALSFVHSCFRSFVIVCVCCLWTTVVRWTTRTLFSLTVAVPCPAACLPLSVVGIVGWFTYLVWFVAVCLVQCCCCCGDVLAVRWMEGWIRKRWRR